MRRRINPFPVSQVKPRTVIGGAVPAVAETAEFMAHTHPMLAARIYAGSPLKNYDDSDPRYAGKSDQVENIYNPAAPEPTKPRSGIAQVFNWLMTGELK